MDTKFRIIGIVQVVALIMVLAGGASAQRIVNVTDEASLFFASDELNVLDGDTIVLAAGIYALDNERINVFTENVTWRGAGSGDDPLVDTILDCATPSAPADTDHRAFVHNGTPGPGGTSENWAISDMRIINGLSPGGGAISNHDNGNTPPNNLNLTMTNVTFEDCDAPARGGVIRAQEGLLTAINCRFINCTSSGGDAGALNIDANGGHMTVVDCTFTDCGAFGDDGGGIFFDSQDGILSVTNCTFTNCTAEDEGGAIFTNENGVFATIDNCVFDGSKAGFFSDTIKPEGDGAHISVDDQSTLIVTNSMFLNGESFDEEGAINMDNNDAVRVDISNSLFVNNKAVTGEAGDPLLADTVVGLRGAEISFINNTLVDNICADDGVVSVFDDVNTTEIVISNNIFLSNSSGDEQIDFNGDRLLANEPKITVTNNCFFNNTTGTDLTETGNDLLVSGSSIDGGTTVTETGRITADPALDFEYKPTAASTAIIDAADPAQATAADLEGTFAIGLRDVGAYEFAGAIVAPLHNWNWNLYR